MTEALDAAVRAAREELMLCGCGLYGRGDIEPVARAALRAALPAEPPKWFGAWWDNGWELSDETEVLGAWLSLRKRILGEDA